MTRYTMPGCSQGNAFMQRTTACLERDGVHRWVFVHNLTPEVEHTVRTRLLRRLNVFYCELQAMYTPFVRSTSPARTHIVLNNTPVSTSSMARNDEAVKALVKATGPSPHLSVYGWPFCLGDPDDAHTGGGAAWRS